MARHYLDHASTSPLRPEAAAAMIQWMSEPAGDPSRIHAEGLRAREALEEARDAVAALLGTRARQVVLTSGATEAIAAACWGAAERGLVQVVSAVEHSAVRAGAAAHGQVALVPVDGAGRVDAGRFLATVDEHAGRVAAAHLQWVNHEVGTVQPVAEVAAGCRERGVLLHVDAAQALGRIEMDLDASGIDLLSVSAHKLGGPPGAGALAVRRGLRIRPLLVGGDQERARRAGMEALPALIGFGAAAGALRAAGVTAEAAAQEALTARLASGLESMEGLTRYGDTEHRAPHLVTVGVAGVEPQAVLLGLDRAGIAAHSGSACASESLEPSPVLEAMGVDAHHSLRLSVGWSSSDDDVDAVLSELPVVLDALRSLRPGPN